MSNFREMGQLSGTNIKLAPLELEHYQGLLEAAADGELWNLWFTSVPTELQLKDYLVDAIEGRKQGKCFPFTVIDSHTNKILGSTRFCNIDSLNRRLEIGYTWYGASSQKTLVNTECKFLMLEFAFDHWGAIAVEFRTHRLNFRSSRAIQRIGASLDGVLRNHQKLANGSYRDTLVYSIIVNEWPAVKNHLQFEMGKPRK